MQTVHRFDYLVLCRFGGQMSGQVGKVLIWNSLNSNLFYYGRGAPPPYEIWDYTQALITIEVSNQLWISPTVNDLTMYYLLMYFKWGLALSILALRSTSGRRSVLLRTTMSFPQVISPMTRHSAVWVCIPLVTSTTSIMTSMIWAPETTQGYTHLQRYQWYIEKTSTNKD